MSFWKKMSGWGSGSTIKARDSDDLSSHYSAEERVRSDYARNYPELNVYASDELRGLSSEDQERLLKLPKARRVEIYKNLNKTFSEDAVKAAGGYREFMSKPEHWQSLQGKAKSLVEEGYRKEAIEANAAAAKKTAGAHEIGDVDDIEMQPLLDKDTRARVNRQKGRQLAADKEAMDDRNAAAARATNCWLRWPSCLKTRMSAQTLTPTML